MCAGRKFTVQYFSERTYMIVNREQVDEKKRFFTSFPVKVHGLITVSGKDKANCTVTCKDLDGVATSELEALKEEAKEVFFKRVF